LNSHPARVFEEVNKQPTLISNSFKPIEPLTIDELMLVAFQQRDPLLTPILNRGDLAMVYGPRGSGKTHLLLALTIALACGGSFGPWSSTGNHGILYLDGELMGRSMLERVALHAPDGDFDSKKLRIFTPELLTEGDALPDLSTPEGQLRVDQAITTTDAVIVIDNLSSWCRSGRENEGESWLSILEWLLSLRRRGHCVILVHHSGKGGDQRGTSRREDHLDLVLKMTLPSDHDPKNGCRFNVEFSKARHLQGSDSQSLEFSMIVENGSAKWSYATCTESTFTQVVTLTNEGISQTEIAKELNINRSTVNRHCKKAEIDGLIAKQSRLAK
jgi:energy-coupling factor transporter ATP-binding protein EcfA2